MEEFERVGIEIVDYINDPYNKTCELITMRGSRFVLCGNSGSGKTRAIAFANKKLPKDQQIAESQDLLFHKDRSTALGTFRNEDLAYANARHIGFNVVDKEIAEEIEKQGEKVFWLKS